MLSEVGSDQILVNVWLLIDAVCHVPVQKGSRNGSNSQYYVNAHAHVCALAQKQINPDRLNYTADTNSPKR